MAAVPDVGDIWSVEGREALVAEVDLAATAIKNLIESTGEVPWFDAVGAEVVEHAVLGLTALAQLAAVALQSG